MGRKSSKSSSDKSSSNKFSNDKYPISALNDVQAELMDNIDDYDLCFAIGYPGVAKTLISVYKAFDYYDDYHSPINKIIVTRNITDADGSKSVGYLKGGLDEKIAPFLEPIWDVMRVFMSPGRVNYIKAGNTVEFIPYEYIRGRTFDDAFIIVEEAQNFTAHQMYTVLTRAGKRSKMVVNGDYMTQRDLSAKFGKSGLEDAVQKLQYSNNVGISKFNHPNHIARSGVAKDVILAYYGGNNHS